MEIFRSFFAESAEFENGKFLFRGVKVDFAPSEMPHISLLEDVKENDEIQNIESNLKNEEDNDDIEEDTKNEDTDTENEDTGDIEDMDLSD
jgi:hypothetical protein